MRRGPTRLQNGEGRWTPGEQPTDAATEAASELVSGESLGVPHVGPGVRLDVGQDLAQVIPVVMDPLVQQIAHSEATHLGMFTSSSEVSVAEVPDQLDARAAERAKLPEEVAGALLAVTALASDQRLIPCHERRLDVLKDAPNASGEAALLGLDEMTEDLLDAPLAGRRMPVGNRGRPGFEFEPQHLGHRPEQRNDLTRRQRLSTHGPRV